MVQNCLSIVIPCFRNDVGLEKTLESISRQNAFGRPMEIIVINDGASPDVSRVAKNYGCNSVELNPARGSYFARNQGLECAKGAIVLFLDDSMSLDAGWIAKALLEIAECDYLCGNVKISAVDFSKAAHVHQHYNGFNIPALFQNHHAGGAGALMVRRQVFEHLGGFDQRLLSGGDMEFGNRVYASGLRQKFLFSPVIWHEVKDLKSLLRQQLRIERGWNQLTTFYPQRFLYRNPTSNIKTFSRAVGFIFPPSRSVFRQTYPELHKAKRVNLVLLLWTL